MKTANPPEISVIQKYLMRTLEEFDAFMQDHQIDYSITYGTLLGAVRHQGFIPWDDDIDIFITPEAFEKFLAVRDQLPPYFKLQRKEEDPGYKVPFPKLRDERCYVLEGNDNDHGSYHGAFIDFFILNGYTENVLPCIEQANRFLKTERLRKKIGRNSPFYTVLGPLKNIERLLNKGNMRRLNAMAGKTTGKDTAYLACPLYIIWQLWPVDAFFPLERKYKFGNLTLPGPRDADAVLKRCGYGNYMELPPVEKRSERTHFKRFDVLVP